MHCLHNSVSKAIAELERHLKSPTAESAFYYEHLNLSHTDFKRSSSTYAKNTFGELQGKHSCKLAVDFIDLLYTSVGYNKL